MLWADAGFYLVAEPADRYPGDNDRGISDLSAERRSISNLGCWREERIGTENYKIIFIAIIYYTLMMCFF